MKAAKNNTCYCYTCEREYHYLGINSHRAAHRRRRENCIIGYTNGKVRSFKFSDTPNSELDGKGAKK